jgi:hypothetical protein
MRIAYVALHLEQKIIQGGVGRKIASHLEIWQEMGHEAKLFLLTPDVLFFPSAQIFPFQSTINKPGWLRFSSREIARSQALAGLIREVRVYSPDVIYLRFGLFSFPLHSLYQIAPVFVELNTVDADEYRYRGRFYYWMNLLARRVELGLASGLVPASREIGTANQEFAKPMRVVTNGIDLRSVQPLPAPANFRPRLVLVGTPGYSWHGVDKLIKFAGHYPDLQIDIVGYGPAEVKGPVPENVRLHGFLSLAGVKQVLSTADVVFGTIALHRKKMQEASPLKIREALGFGIPVILPYDDTDFLDNVFDFILQIPNTEDNLVIHGDLVHDFSYRMRGKRADIDAIRVRIDQREKERNRLAFFEQVVQRKTS